MKLVLIVAVCFVGLLGSYIYFNTQFFLSEEKSTIEKTEIIDTQKKEIFVEDSLFKVLVPYDKLIIDSEQKTITYSEADFELKPDLMNIYNDIGFSNNSKNAVVIYPTFTETAYQDIGFYSFYRGDCDSSCLTIPISHSFKGEYSSSRAAFNALRILGYQTLTDIEVDKKPEILKEYEKIILLHNEYVTEEMFKAITDHPKVIYLYPNALYAQISVDYEKDVITLVRGHNYPDISIRNGFDWKHDNTNPYEYDNVCKDWNFYEIDNGIMLNCYPEYIIFKDELLLKTIKDF